MADKTTARTEIDPNEATNAYYEFMDIGATLDKKQQLITKYMDNLPGSDLAGLKNKMKLVTASQEYRNLLAEEENLKKQTDEHSKTGKPIEAFLSGPQKLTLEKLHGFENWVLWEKYIHIANKMGGSNDETLAQKQEKAKEYIKNNNISTKQVISDLVKLMQSDVYASRCSVDEETGVSRLDPRQIPSNRKSIENINNIRNLIALYNINSTQISASLGHPMAERRGLAPTSRKFTPH